MPIWPGFVTTMEFVAQNQLKRIGGRGGLERWQASGNDPQFLLRRGRLPPGRYRLSLGVTGDEPALRTGRVYYDVGRGHNEEDSAMVRFPTPSSVGEVILKLPSGAASLRFDPSDQPCEFDLGASTLVRTPIFVWRVRRLSGLLRQALRRPDGLQRIASVLSAAWRDGGLRAMRKAITHGLRTLEGAGGHRAAYPDWVALYDTPTPRQVERLREEAASMQPAPLISVLMPTYNTPERYLVEVIESVRGQIYPNWELCIADDGSTQPHVRRLLDEYMRRDPRIKVAFRAENGHISHASNTALELVTGDWVALLDHDDVLRPLALLAVAREIRDHPDAQLIYSDEDKIDDEGRRFDAYFKPDFSLELLRSQNYLNHLTVHRTGNIRAVGGWRPGYEGSQDYDLNLRIVERVAPGSIRHIPKVLYHWRTAAGSTALSGSQKNYAYDAGMRALEDHVARTSIAAQVETAGALPFYRLRHAIPDPKPLVSLIIPTRDRVDLLRNCIGSIVARTRYSPYEIIVMDNDSAEAGTLAYFAEISASPAIRVVKWEGPFNYSAINNAGVAAARGEVVGLVNNDIEVISPDWLDEMVSWAVQPDIGCVGAKLYYADDTIQHGGVIVGLGGIANHSHKSFPRQALGYFGQLHCVRNVSAVTGACLFMRKSLYEEIGGLNEKDLAVAFNDVDLCLRVREAGYRNVWTPYCELYHLESVSRGRDDDPVKRARFLSEIAYMETRWAQALRLDPFYSPNLTSSSEDYGLGFPPKGWDQNLA